MKSNGEEREIALAVALMNKRTKKLCCKQGRGHFHLSGEEEKLRAAAVQMK